ncbi:uncharacterized protein LOC131688014 [Topomyia yanbarensis]|uniref:uncharacterized protein LOC131688014 n=1 Tax=Topomyia yanbarensis TaxID=2498891 RepID=UPI00273B0F9E|nr:uncharacterized protein LOC131688014 [Topomyia yanbarensis]
MWWNSSTDTFTFKLPTKPGEDLLSGRCVPTKREVVRVLMSIFDPLGLLGNILMYLKILIQEVWRSGIGWDEVITSTQLEKWRTWLGVIEKVETVSVPRCYRLTTSCSTQTNVQLHIFVDASINGIAAVAYLRFEENDKIECAFVAAKTRVAPNKLTSIPRLELQAAVVGVRLARTVAESHRININKRLFWTDARDVLCWLHSDHRRFSPFVGFRVGEILENSELSEWRWVPSKLNPADDGTKWQRTPDLSQNSRWVRGQDFIWEKQTEWPEMLTHIGTTTLEQKHSVGLHCASASVIDCEKFSTWKRLLRHTAQLKRYVRNLKTTIDGAPLSLGELTKEELLAAESYLHRIAQESVYLEKIAALTRAANCDDAYKYHLPKSSSIYQLSPYLDNFDVMRMRGRTGACEYTEPDASCPIILPRNHHVTELIVRSVHWHYHHLNHETVVNEIRQKYRIPKLRRVCYKIRMSCQT